MSTLFLPFGNILTILTTIRSESGSKPVSQFNNNPVFQHCRPGCVRCCTSITHLLFNTRSRDLLKLRAKEQPFTSYTVAVSLQGHKTKVSLLFFLRPNIAFHGPGALFISCRFIKFWTTIKPKRTRCSVINSLEIYTQQGLFHSQHIMLTDSYEYIYLVFTGRLVSKQVFITLFWWKNCITNCNALWLKISLLFF